MPETPAATSDAPDAADAEALWHRRAMDGWADAAQAALTAADDERALREALETELAALRASVSWRVTRPLRAVAHLRPTRRAR
ncbi:MAG: hypothetical protein HGA44_21650 [Cellulomonadaceae bacterium]|nr:hypothetical protein [Cellulomonadaceae bacterium]